MKYNMKHEKKLIFHYAYSAFFECMVHILCFERSVVTVFSRFQRAGAPNRSVPQNICSSEKKITGWVMWKK